MRKIAVILLITLFLFSHISAYAAIATVENKLQWRAQIFIANQIKGIGLVDSYQEDATNKSYVYDDALAAIASIAMGNFGLAKEILDTLAFEVKKTSKNVPYERYLYSDTTGAGQGTAYSGNSAWLLQALNLYQKLKKENIYPTTQKSLADYILSLQDPVDGGIWGYAGCGWKSTEHNLIAYVAVRNYGRINNLPDYVTKAEKIKVFLKSEAVWDGVRFGRGAWDTTEVVDVQALGVIVLGSYYSNALTWAESTLKLTRSFNATTVTGFDFNNDLDTVWIEGTLQMARAFSKIGDTTKGSYYYNEAIKTKQSDGSLLLATNPGTASDEWYMQVWRSIAPTCWLIFCYMNFNPLVMY
jgi:hypothetical protein